MTKKISKAKERHMRGMIALFQLVHGLRKITATEKIKDFIIKDFRSKK